MIAPKPPELFESVFCAVCLGFGRSITLYRKDRFGNLFFLGKLMLMLTFDVQLQSFVVPCRVCGNPTRVDLTGKNILKQ